MSYRPRTAPRPTTPEPVRAAALRRPAQVLVWVLFAIVALVGLSAAGALTPSHDPGPAAVSVSAAGPKAGTTVPPAALDTEPMKKYHIVSASGSNADAALELLPAYRWRDNVDLVSDLGWRDIGAGGATMVGGALFSLASFLWTLLLTVMRFGLTTDLITGAATSINAGFASMARSIGSSGLIAVAFVAVLLAGIAAFFRGNLPKVLAMFFMFALPIGGMQALAVGANGGTDKFVPPLSPAGLAITGNQTINQIGGTLATGFGVTNQLSDATRKAQLSGGNTSPDCSYYIARLYSTYAAASAKGGKSGLNGSLWATKGGNVSAADVKDQLSANSGLVTVSYLWERAFLPAWTQAQFGNISEGSLMACHRLELNNQTTPSEQMVLALGNDKASPYTGFARGPFTPIASEKEGQVAMFAWAACANGKGTVARPGWADLASDTQKITSPQCVGWKGSEGAVNKDTPVYDFVFGGKNKVTGDRGDRVLDFKDTGDLARATTPPADANAATSDALQHVQESVRAYWGHNAGQRMLWGLIACLTSALYLWALGAMALGAIIAQVGLVVMLIVLPATLVMFALPRNGPGGRHPAGARLLKLTGGFMAAKLVLIFSLTLLIQLIAILESIVGGDGSGIWSAIIPIAAMLALRALLKSIGFGDITKLGGALAMSGAGGALMAGDKKFAQSFQKGMDPAQQIQNRAKKIGENARTLNALKSLGRDTLAAKAAKGVGRGALAGAGAGLGAAKKAGAHVGGFAADEARSKYSAGLTDALDKAKNGDPDALRKYQTLQKMADLKGAGMGFLSGYRDPETGQKMSSGVLGRLGSLSGLTMAMADKGMLDKGGLAYRFATHNRASASRAEILREQHAMAAALHAKRKDAGVDPEERRKITAGFWDGQLTSLAHLTQDTEHGVSRRLDGDVMNMNAAEIALEKGRFAALAGCDTDMVIASRIALPSVVDTTHAPGRVIPQFSTDADTIENAKSIIHYLPKDWTATRPGESDEHRHARIVASMRAMGGMDANGVLSDTLAAFGVDVTTVEGKAEVLKAARGQRSKLDNIVIDIPADVRKAIEDSLKINTNISFHAKESGQALIDVRTEHGHALDAHAKAQHEALTKALGEVSSLTAKIATGGSDGDQTARVVAAKAEEVVNTTLREMEESIAEMRGLTLLNNNPGKEQESLRHVSQALEELNVNVQDQLADIARMNAQMIQADDAQRADIARKLERKLSDMVDHAAAERDKTLAELVESQTAAHDAYRRAKSMQLQKAMRGKSFAGGTAPLPVR